MSASGKTAAQSQGIISILGSDSERTKFSSLRRTLSADMSSRKWLSQNVLSSMKKIASFEEISTLVEDDCQENEQQCIWNSIQEQDKKGMDNKSGQFDIWSSIVCENAQQNISSPTPYIHPLVKSCSSSLSVKSLEICTESLGSETGSDGFSSYCSSEDGDANTENEKEENEQEERVPPQLPFDNEQVEVVKYNFAVGKKTTHRSFPPPLPSLSNRDGAAMLMQSHRHNGRLVLEAVCVPTKQNFHAQRQDGRLVLTFIPDQEETKKEMVENEQLEEVEEVFESKEEEYEVEEEESVVGDNKIMLQKVANFHRLAMMMNKPIEVENRNLTWGRRMNKGVKFGREEPLTQSVTPWTPVAPVGANAKNAANCFNAYEYFWREKPSDGKYKSLPLHNNGNKHIISKNPIAKEQKTLLAVKGVKEDCIVINSWRGCKEARRSISFGDSYCIATS